MRPVFVGDVQGCADELDEIVGRADAGFGDDWELWSVGDVVNRGPASRRALERIRALHERGRARVVLGNHELGFLRVALGQRAPGPGDTLRELLEAPDRDAWVDWVRGWPLAETGRLGGQRFGMVHAAVAPDWSLDDLSSAAHRAEARLRASRGECARLLAADPESDPDADALARLTRCRTVDRRGRWSSAPPASPADAWHRRWSAAGHDYGVVYGHWAMQGLHVAPNLRGLDTGCVYDGELTAWLPEPEAPAPFSVPDQRFWQVRARRHYWDGETQTVVQRESG